MNNERRTGLAFFRAKLPRKRAAVIGEVVYEPEPTLQERFLSPHWIAGFLISGAFWFVGAAWNAPLLHWAPLSVALVGAVAVGTFARSPVVFHERASPDCSARQAPAVGGRACERSPMNSYVKPLSTGANSGS